MFQGPKAFRVERKWVFATNSNFLIPISLQHDGAPPFDISNLDYFRILSLKYLRSMTLDYKDIGIRKSKFVTKNQFLSSLNAFGP